MLLDLIARVETGEGEDRDLDFAIRQAADEGFHDWHRWALREAALYRDGWVEGCGRKKLGPILLRHRKSEAVSIYRRFALDSTPKYTASLDDAATLFRCIPDLIPSSPRKVITMALRERLSGLKSGGQSCQRCGSSRILNATAHCSDLFYVPHDLGIGGGDDLDIALCLDCGQVQGTWPLPRSQHEARVEKVAQSIFGQQVVQAAEESDVDFSTVLLKLLETEKVEDVVDGLRALESHAVRPVRELVAVILSYMETNNLDMYPAILKAFRDGGK